MTSGWWWSGLWADHESPMADSFINTSFSAYPGNVHIPPRPVLCPPLLSLDTFCLVDLIFFHLFNHIPFVDNSQTSFINPWPLCWAPEPCVQLFLDNPSGSITGTSHSTFTSSLLPTNPATPPGKWHYHLFCFPSYYPENQGWLLYHPNFHIQHSLNPAGVAS